LNLSCNDETDPQSGLRPRTRDLFAIAGVLVLSAVRTVLAWQQCSVVDDESSLQLCKQQYFIWV